MVLTSIPSIHKTFSPLFNPAAEVETKTSSLNQLKKRFTWLDGELAGKQFLMGDTFTVADGYLFTVTNWAKYVGLDLSELANLQAYSARIASRPAVVAAMKAEGLLK